MVFNATFNNISVISWLSDVFYLMEETGVPGKNNMSLTNFITYCCMSTPDSNSQLYWRLELKIVLNIIAFLIDLKKKHFWQVRWIGVHLFWPIRDQGSRIALKSNNIHKGAWSCVYSSWYRNEKRTITLHRKSGFW